jgi:hypothetical protein
MTMYRRCLFALVLGVVFVLGGEAQQPTKPGAGPAKGAAPKPVSDIDLVEKVLNCRRDYQVSLEALRAHYVSTNEPEKVRWAEDELRQFHRMNKQAYNLKLDVPPETLKAELNIPEANELYIKAMEFKNKGGWGDDYIDNMRRAELLFQQLLTSYPQSNKIGDTAYQLGDLYEGKAFKHYRRAAVYFERCFRWHSNTHFDARLRAAHLYDRTLNDRSKAVELYQEVLTNETDPKWREEAQKRLTELRATKN